MKASEIRRELQNGDKLLASDWTRWHLYLALKETREEFGGLALMEIAEVIKEALGDDAEILKGNL